MYDYINQNGSEEAREKGKLKNYIYIEEEGGGGRGYTRDGGG